MSSSTIRRISRFWRKVKTLLYKLFSRGEDEVFGFEVFDEAGVPTLRVDDTTLLSAGEFNFTVSLGRNQTTSRGFSHLGSKVMILGHETDPNASVNIYTTGTTVTIINNTPYNWTIAIRVWGVVLV